MSTSQIAPAPSFQPSNFGTYSPTGNQSSSKDKHKSSADSISLSPVEAAAAFTGLAAAGALLGGGVTYAMRGTSRSASSAPDAGNTPDTSQQSHVYVHNRIHGASIVEHIPVFSTSLNGSGNYPSPLEMDGPRFHPAQTGANCAVDMLNMLVNGYGPLRTSVTDYRAMMLGYDADGSKGEPIAPNSLKKYSDHQGDAPMQGASHIGTITDPHEMPAVYMKNFAIAKQYIERLSDPEKKSAWLSSLTEISYKAGELGHEIYEPGKDNPELQRKMNAFSQKAFGVGSPTKTNSLGLPQKLYKFDHHYFTIERQSDGTWARRDSATEHLISLELHGKPAKTPYDALLAAREFEEKRDKSSMHPTREMHVFLPKPAMR